MKYIGRGVIKGLQIGLISFMSVSFLTACGKEYTFPYDANSSISSFAIKQTSITSDASDTFASDYCITDTEVPGSVEMESDHYYAAGLFDLQKKEVLYANNVHTQLNPASLTKVMTALCALKYGNMDDVITCSENVLISESGAQLMGLKPGDHLTLSQALYALLMNSANDAAVAIAEHISGSVEEFCDLMNQEALAIGATNCHFVNPNGLTADGHLVSAYDMYLIFYEAIQYEEFVSIIQMTSYESIYHDVDGNEKTMSFDTTNQFLKGAYKAPDGITVIGGKTGSTNAARSCLVLLAKHSGGNPYIAVILGDTERGLLYEDMVKMLQNVVHS